MLVRTVKFQSSCKRFGVQRFGRITPNSELKTLKATSNNSEFVTPVKTGVQEYQGLLDSGFRWNDIFKVALILKPDPVFHFHFFVFIYRHIKTDQVGT